MGKVEFVSGGSTEATDKSLLLYAHQKMNRVKLTVRGLGVGEPLS